MTEQMKRRTFLATTAGLGAILLTGCTSENNGTGRFQLLISDQPTAIGDFDSLDVTLSSARVFRTDDEEENTSPETNETENETETDEDTEDEGFVEFDLDRTVDLTQVTGDLAVEVLEDELEAGRYSGIELRVASAEGVVDGEDVDVKVPSNKLRLVKPFEISADEELSFVFDINVIQKGPMGGYNLLPVIGKSGVAGKDVEVEEIETEDNATT